MHVQSVTSNYRAPQARRESEKAFIDGYRAARLDWKRGLLYTTYPANTDDDWRDGYRKFCIEFDGLIASRRIADLKKCNPIFAGLDVTDASLANRKRIVDRLDREAKRLAYLARTDPFDHFYNLPTQRMIQRLCKQEMAIVAYLTGEGA